MTDEEILKRIDDIAVGPPACPMEAIADLRLLFHDIYSDRVKQNAEAKSMPWKESEALRLKQLRSPPSIASEAEPTKEQL